MTKKLGLIAGILSIALPLTAAELSDKPGGFASIKIAEGAYKAPNGTIGGGDILPVVATDVRSLALLLLDDEPRTVLIANDIDMTFPSETMDAPPNVDLLNQPDIDGLPNGTRPRTHPFFFENGRLARVPCSIRVGSNKTIYSADGKTIRHGGFVIREKSNVIIRNLKFADLWEWDEITYPLWDRNTWDFVRIEETSHHVWVDHCTFQQSYDGYVDVVRKSDFITVSYCKYDASPMLALTDNPEAFAKEFDASWIGRQYNHLVATKAPKFLSDPTVTGKDLEATSTKIDFVKKWGRHWKNTLIGNSNARTFDRTHLNVTLHHNWWHHSVSRAPRARFGNIHLFNNLIEGMDNAVMTGFEASILVQNCYFLNGKNLLYGDEGVGRAIGCVLHGKPKSSDAGFAKMCSQSGAIDSKSKPETIIFKNPKPASWHEVGDWWIPNSGEMEETLPYSFSVDPTEKVPEIVVASAGAGKITLPEATRKLAVAEHWNLNCASCHGAKGDAKTVVGLRWEMKDYTKAEHQKSFDDAYAEKLINEGMSRDALYRMAPYKDRLPPEMVGELVAYIRAMAKPADLKLADRK